jgi:hypothetical protein
MDRSKILISIGLFANVIGAMFLAFSLDVFDSAEDLEGPIIYSEKEGKVITWTVTQIDETYFNIGISFLIIGFLIQFSELVLYDRWLKKREV